MAAPNRADAIGGAPQQQKPWKPLAGVYKTFFIPSSHAAVEAWYNVTANLQERHAFKDLVKEITRFDMAAALAKTTKATCDPEIALANAIVVQQGGDHLTDASRKKAVEFLSTAHPSKREVYRRIFGLITRPSNLCSLRHIEDMNPKNFYVEVDTSLVTKKKMIGAEHLHRKSEMLTLPANAQTGNRTHYQQSFVWKVGAVPLAYSQRAQDRRDAQLAQQAEDTELLAAVQEHLDSGVTTAFVAPLKKKKSTLSSPPEAAPAAAASAGTSTAAKTPPPDLMPTPWGVLNTGNVDGTQWESVTHDTFKETYFLQPKDQRKFQNLNDNYSRMVYLTRRKMKKEKRLAAAAALGGGLGAEEDASARSPTSIKGAASASSPLSQTQYSAGSALHKHLFANTNHSAPGSAYSGGGGGARSASGPLVSQTLRVKAPINTWLEEKGRRPVSVIFPSI